MKVQVKRAFKNLFFVTKKIIKNQTGSAQNFLQHPVILVIILLLLNVAYSEGLFSYDTSISRYFQFLVEFPRKHFLYCSDSACSDCPEGFGWSTQVVSEKF